MIEEIEGDYEDEEIPYAQGSLMEFRTGHLDDVLKEKLENAFHKQTSHLLLHDVAKIASEHDPIDLAVACHRLPQQARYFLFENLPDLESKIIFLINTESASRAAIFRHISDEELVDLVNGMPPDEAVVVLEALSERRFRRIMEKVEWERAKVILDLKKHARNTAGRLMTNEFFAFPMNATLGEVAARIRDNPGIDLTRSIFVVTDQEELAGYVPVRNLIVNPPFVPLRQVMRPVLQTVTVDTSRDEVVDIVERYGIPTLPVIDNEDHLVGIIVYEDVVEAMEDIADETIASIAGTAESISEHEPTLIRFFGRAPWLIVTLLAGMISFFTQAHFRDRPWVSFIPMVVPLIAGMSGNIGLQCSTILVRGMATGELSRGSRREAIGEELLIGLLIGCVFGLLSGFVVFGLIHLGLMHPGADSLHVGLTVSAGVLCASLTATFMGTFSPFFFARVGIDPAVASGPIVTAFNDVTSMLMFYLVAWMIYAFIV
jgi:magnesium transporter